MRIRIIISTVLFFFLLTVNMMAAESADDALNLVWVIVDQTSLEELKAASTPNIEFLQTIGAFGLMNVRTAGQIEPESTYLTLGAGKRAQGSKISHIARKDQNGAVNPEISTLQGLNAQNPYHPELGLLGSICREKGITIAVIGNTDTQASKRRTIISMLMDSQGRVPLADISQSILKNVDLSYYPWGYQTDWEKVKEGFLFYRQYGRQSGNQQDSQDQSRVQALVIESGDTSRIETYSSILGQERTKEEKIRALERLDEFIGFLLEEVDLARTQIGLIVPTPHRRSLQKDKHLSWVLLAGQNYQQGWLKSASSRRKGILVLSDLFSAFLEGNGLRESSIETIKAQTDWQELISLNNKLTAIYLLRSPFIKGFILVQVLVLLLAIIKTVCKKFNELIINSALIEYLLLSLFLVPINYLLLAFLTEAYLILLFLIILTCLELFFLFRFFSDRLSRILTITWTLVILISLDLLTGYHLLADSLLGYSSVIGARYYGLGNEYMGFYIGSLLISLYGLLELIKNRVKSLKQIEYLLFIFWPVAVYFIGANNLGANFGGMVTALLAGGISYFHLKKGRGNRKIIVVCLLLLLLIIMLDYLEITGPRSHIGQALGSLLKGDYQVIITIIFRKLSMNLKLLRWTIWTRVLLAFMVYLLIIFNYPVSGMKKIFQRYSYLTAAFYGALAGSIVAMLVNDSGVVAAATILFYPMFTLLYLINNYK